MNTTTSSGPRRPRASRRGGEQPSPLDMVSFNCNLTRDARAKAKMYAASVDVALQDVVEAALIGYLEPRGFPIERRPGAALTGAQVVGTWSPEDGGQPQSMLEA